MPLIMVLTAIIAAVMMPMPRNWHGREAWNFLLDNSVTLVELPILRRVPQSHRSGSGHELRVTRKELLE